uniref:Uncharacterized protein n=1 Tax=virus sp. ctML55 TaxID=2827627 RepID=A0A8S5RIR1_9VIRU|nr:MAG TPA: hypothetical protein [virus sp. ctML55]
MIPPFFTNEIEADHGVFGTPAFPDHLVLGIL